ncbi:serine/threonine-protein kinase [Propioniciclava sinopodophylli]|uniref:serine/threonine-protein kinase n=1 Tax=Propioniciclava sinopodophylli TaxID=1837344 RepID=UPI001F4F235B|nr:serine/threonine-protein kinase [Propioniciclava sinopodophylli]
MEIELQGGKWQVGDVIGGGGFGAVRLASGPLAQDAVAKFVPAVPGAQREVLVGDSLQARGLPRVIPTLDSGEVGGNWVLIMPRAEYSLRDLMVNRGEPLPQEQVIDILRQVAEGIHQISEAGIIHRDLKPENILYWNDSWVLCDFGIARYRDASTDPATRKFSMTRPYAAPEQWLEERASSATDVYAFGVIAYELLTGKWPFGGEDFRHQHLHEKPPMLNAGPQRLRILVEECLYKPAGARPNPDQLVARLANALSLPVGAGANKLAAVSERAAASRAAENALAQQQLTEQGRRDSLFDAARYTFEVIPAGLLDAIMADAPMVQIDDQAGRGIMCFVGTLGVGRIEIYKPRQVDKKWHGPFDVIAVASIAVTQPMNNHGYAGRAHSLWYCDAQVEGAYAWYELAFMEFALGAGSSSLVPHSDDPQDVGHAFSGVIGAQQLAWSPERLERDDLSDFIDRWLGWFAEASEGQLTHPTNLPERRVADSYRRS